MAVLVAVATLQLNDFSPTPQISWDPRKEPLVGRSIALAKSQQQLLRGGICTLHLDMLRALAKSSHIDVSEVM